MWVQDCEVKGWFVVGHKFPGGFFGNLLGGEVGGYDVILLERIFDGDLKWKLALRWLIRVVTGETCIVPVSLCPGLASLLNRLKIACYCGAAARVHEALQLRTAVVMSGF